MGTQPLSDRSVRRIARETGLDLAFGAAHGSYIHQFVTVDHRHGWYDLKTKEWGWNDYIRYHFTTCRRLFSGDFG